MNQPGVNDMNMQMYDEEDDGAYGEEAYEMMDGQEVAQLSQEQMEALAQAAAMGQIDGDKQDGVEIEAYYDEEADGEE